MSRSTSKSATAADGASAKATLAFGRLMIRGGLQQIAATMQEVDLTLTQLGSLIMLQQRGALSVSEIAKGRSLSLGATSHMLNRLVARDMVKREEDPTDRRQKRITLGSAGVTLLARFDLGRERALAHLLASVPRPLQAELENILARVLASITDPNSSPS
ncbi:MAG: MarR family transcriptional regulator [bacterium]